MPASAETARSFPEEDAPRGLLHYWGNGSCCLPCIPIQNWLLPGGFQPAPPWTASDAMHSGCQLHPPITGSGQGAPAHGFGDGSGPPLSLLSLPGSAVSRFYCGQEGAGPTWRDSCSQGWPEAVQDEPGYLAMPGSSASWPQPHCLKPGQSSQLCKNWWSCPVPQYVHTNACVVQRQALCQSPSPIQPTHPSRSVHQPHTHAYKHRRRA